MSSRLFLLPLALVLIVGGYHGVSAQQAAPVGGVNLFDGEWTLTFDVATPPGGVTLRGMYGDSNAPYHMAFQASKRLFRVKADGKIAWRDVDDGCLRIDSTYNPPPAAIGAQTTTWWESHRPLLKVNGTATATPSPPGAPQPYERNLQIDLDWSGGNGAYAGSGGGSGTYIVDAEGEQLTVTGPTTTTIPVTYWQAKWTLKPARTEREEISADEIRETTTYEGSRQAEVPTVLGKYKVTERIEVKHVRNLKLVPRG